MGMAHGTSSMQPEAGPAAQLLVEDDRQQQAQREVEEDVDAASR